MPGMMKKRNLIGSTSVNDSAIFTKRKDSRFGNPKKGGKASHISDNHSINIDSQLGDY